MKYWSKKNLPIGEEPVTSEFFMREPQILEVVNNRIYFYSEVNRRDILQLNKTIRLMNNEIITQNIITESMGSTPIILHINSYGGGVFDGLSSMDEILNSRVPVYTIVDGCCASAATFISIAGKKRFIKKHSFMLIHQISSMMWGTYQEFVDEMENQKKLMSIIKNIYKKFTKIPMKKLEEILKHNLWLEAEVCLGYGLVDEIID